MSSDILIFGTTYIDSDHKQRLLHHWLNVTLHLNKDCDVLIVDSHSPRAFNLSIGVRKFTFNDNIGHLHKSLNGRNGPRGRDGWGRAFCKGLEIGIADGFEYIIFIEADSIFRLPCRPIVEQMKLDGTKVATTDVKGMVRNMPGWIETGLMFFNAKYVQESDFIRRYDWPNRKASPTPEAIIGGMIKDDVKLMPWRAFRGDKNTINKDNVLSLKLDWLTHCWTDIAPYDVFAESILAG